MDMTCIFEMFLSHTRWSRCDIYLKDWFFGVNHNMTTYDFWQTCGIWRKHSHTTRDWNHTQVQYIHVAQSTWIIYLQWIQWSWFIMNGMKCVDECIDRLQICRLMRSKLLHSTKMMKKRTSEIVIIANGRTKYWSVHKCHYCYYYSTTCAVHERVTNAQCNAISKKIFNALWRYVFGVKN